MNVRKLGPAVAGLLAAGLALSACGGTSAGTTTSSTTSSSSAAASSTGSSSASSAADGSAAAAGGVLLDKAATGALTVGIKFDQPGLGLQEPDGSFSGFDVEVAKYVAGKMGVQPEGITFVQTKSAEREDAIANGTVDFIVATYSITDARKEKVNFAGPYFIAHQNLLVKNDSDITGPDAMSGRILCSVSGSTSAQKVKDTYAADVALQEASTYTECVENLIAGTVDAVTTDDIILAGYAAQYPGELKIAGDGFSDENYGIGLKKDDEAGTQALNDAIAAMIADGSWKSALEATVGSSDFEAPTPS